MACSISRLACVGVLAALSLGADCEGSNSAGPAPCFPENLDGEDQCVSDEQCDDGLFCNGREECRPGTADASECGCRRGLPACVAGNTCDEAADRCVAPCTDEDGDGACVEQGDCDDDDPDRAPGNDEICDAADLDEDCDPATIGDRDGDGDGYADAACCNGTSCGDDCNDATPGVHPHEAESCNELDDDCDGLVDEGVTMIAYLDADRDNHGSTTTATICPYALGAGYAVYPNDCDDANPAIRPGAIECVSSQTPGTLRTCTQAGAFVSGKCLDGESCFPQPNGLGVCR